MATTSEAPTWNHSRLAVTMLAAVLALATVVATGPPAEAACSGRNLMTTSSFMWTLQNQSASWTEEMSTAGGPCVDVNVRSRFITSNCRGAYFGSDNQWHHGSAGWVYCPTGSLKVVISSLSGVGIRIFTGSNFVSTAQEILT